MMEIPKGLEYLCQTAIHTVDMHTTGEPTRIVYKGYPLLKGTLLEQRAQAQNQYDYIRKQLMWEPRGHREMYGAILCQNTELTKSGEAHIGVLFTTNGGYSTMCGHATIAVGRFLVDTQDRDVFPRRKELKVNHESKTVRLNLHAPCGLVKVDVPVEENGVRTDVSKPVSFICVPSFKVARSLQMPIPEEYRWPELGRAKSLCINLAYGGAFYCIVEAVSMGFDMEVRDYEKFYKPLNNETLGFVTPQLPALDHATRLIRSAINANAQLRKLIRHPEHDELSFLYSVIVTYPSVPMKGDKLTGMIDWQELGICFFANQQLDRSPTGSGVAARVALYADNGTLRYGGSRRARKWVFHSLLSIRDRQEDESTECGGFIGEDYERVKIPNRHGPEIDAVLVKIEGHSFYSGFHTFLVESSDRLGKTGFLVEPNGRIL